MIIEGDYDEDNAEFGGVRVDGEPLDPRHSQTVFNHSPDGFSWGYGGSGPAQLGLAVLLKAGLTPEDAVMLHLRFAAAHIATLPRNSFRIEVDIDAWVAENRKTTAMPTRNGE